MRTKKLSHLDASLVLREEFEAVLTGPGVTWNLKGILNAYDKAMAKTAFRIAEIESQP